MCWQLIGRDSLFVEPVARLIPNDTGPVLGSPMSSLHPTVCPIVSAITAAFNNPFRSKMFQRKIANLMIMFLSY